MNVQATVSNTSASQVQAPVKLGRKKLSDDVIRQRQELVEQERLRKENERKQKAAQKAQDKLESVAKRKKKNI